MGEDKRRVREKAMEVCECMKGWQLDDREDLYGTVLSNGVRSLMFAPIWGNTERMEISGYYGDLGRFLPYDREKAEITVSMAKTPERMARDIEKRLLPAYERVLARVMEGKKGYDRYEAEKREVLESVRQAIGRDAHVIQDDRVVSYRPFHCLVKYRSGKEVVLELTLPLAKAVGILSLLGKRPDIKI